MVPNGWLQSPLGSLVERVSKPVSVDTERIYQQIGIRSHGKGLFDKEPVPGSALGNKRVFWVEPHCLVLNIVFAWEQAVGITTEREIGKIASHRFPMFKPRAGRSDVDYLAYFFKTSYGKHLLALASPGGAGRNKTLGQAEFLNTVVCAPPIHEQKIIVRVLKTWDGALETARKLLQNSEAQKRSLMQQLLCGTKRLSEFSYLPWHFVPLKTLCAIRRGASPRPIDDPKWFSEQGRGWVRISDVTRSKSECLESTDQYLSPLGVEKSVPVDPGELIMSICATIGVPKIVGIPVCIHDGFVVFREVKPELHLGFLRYLLEFYAPQLANNGQPGTQKNLNTSIVGNIQVPSFSRREQETIAQTLRVADELVRTHASRLERMRQERAALMQQLLTGKLRVKAKGAV